MIHVTVSGKSLAIFLDGGHCRDGDRARCKTCNRTWEHVCDEAEGCAWHCRSLRALAERTK